MPNLFGESKTNEHRLNKNKRRTISKMNYESWKSMLVSKQQLQRMIHTNPSPLEKEILRASVDKLEAKIMCAPEHYWKDYVGEYKK